MMQDSTWGVAYKVDPRDVPEVMKYLNHREKNGYTTIQLLFYPVPHYQAQPFLTLMYIATTSNPMFLGPASIDDIARQVVSSRGPSGCNTEYVLNLARATREMTPPSAWDDHLFALERKINQMAEAASLVKGERGAGGGCGSGSQGEEEVDNACTCNFCHLLRT